ncbi:sulfurtransferase [uncultured Microbulbifer sp.]|uniref:sulfurtransferase n=1 Tax=uncultured Microbulbifer sp. TaxID=348147 RepID=UPI0025CDC7AB|nr:sulfurtransferase [uncultured Microbulbifer sp.]
MNYQGVIETSELAQLIGDPQLVILDCRYDLAATDAGQQEFLNGHLPGAHYASLHHDLSGPCQRYGGRHPLPSREQFTEFARGKGISADSQVVVYDNQRFAFAARAWWLFRHFGHQRVAILNGGFRAWEDAHLPLETGPAKAVAAGDFTARVGDGDLLHHDDIYPYLANPPWQLVDARDTRRFAGNEEPIDPIAGHIPTAVNMPWQQVTDSDGFLRPLPELKAHWQSIPADEDIVCYCGSGVTACVNLFALAQLERSARLYPGSWSDWCAQILHPRKASEQA